MRNAIYSRAKFDRDLLGLPRNDMVDTSLFSVASNCRFRYEMAQPYTQHNLNKLLVITKPYYFLHSWGHGFGRFKDMRYLL